MQTTQYHTLKKITASFGVENWAYRCSFSKGKEWFGMKKNTAEDILANADLVLNMAGATRFAEENLKVGRLVYYGTDPVYHEIKYAEGDGYTRSIIDEHDDVVSYGENIGNEDCSIPPLPQLKAKTRQPVVLDLWESVGPTKKEFTTVGNWKQSGRDLDFNGKTYYWSKHYEFLKFIDLPKRMSQPIELATNLSKPRTILDFSDTSDPESIGIAEDDYSMLISNGWFLADGPSFTTDPWTYRNYILQSRGEFTCSKDQNVRLRSGWFSERSACYLAASRPLLSHKIKFLFCDMVILFEVGGMFVEVTLAKLFTIKVIINEKPFSLIF